MTEAVEQQQEQQQEQSQPQTPQPSLTELPTRVLELDRIKPYWRNPRRVPEEAVDALVESIRLYGYQQPIVVDTQNVIIVGHTRYAALRKMKAEKVAVVVADLPADKAKQYRLIDNRTSELTSWDYNSLVLELREWDSQLLESFFPDIDLGLGDVDEAEMRITAEAIQEAETKVHTLPGWEPVEVVEVVCPQCFHTFEIRRDSVASLFVEGDDTELARDEQDSTDGDGRG